MAFETRPNSGALFNQRDTKKNPKAPDYKGDVVLTCPHCEATFKRELAGWIRATQAGKTFLSLKVSEPFVKGGRNEVQDPEW